MIFLKLVQANLEICKHLAQGKKVYGEIATKDLLLIFPEPGYYGYFFKKEDIAFSIEKVKMRDVAMNAVWLSSIKPANEIKLTDVIYRNGGYDQQVFLAKNNEKTTINTKYLRNIDLDICRFYQCQARNSPVIAVERKVPVMMLMPIVRPFENEDPLKTYFNDEFTDDQP